MFIIVEKIGDYSATIALLLRSIKQFLHAFVIA